MSLWHESTIEYLNKICPPPSGMKWISGGSRTDPHGRKCMVDSNGVKDALPEYIFEETHQFMVVPEEHMSYPRYQNGHTIYFTAGFAEASGHEYCAACHGALSKPCTNPANHAPRMEAKMKEDDGKPVEKLTWEVEVEDDGDSARVRLREGEKSVAYALTRRRIFGTLKAAIDRTKAKILAARNLSKAESGLVYVPYQPRK